MESNDQKEMPKTLPPGQTPVERLLKWGRDHPTIKGLVPKIDKKKYTLVLCGEVEKPSRLSWSAILKFPKAQSVSDFHCVEGWSVLGLRWEGVRFKRVEELVKPKPTARFATFECADEYTTSLSLQELAGDDVLLAYIVNGKYLEEGTGAPLRLVVPDKYAYKSAMWITKIEFTSEKEIGYWENRGYSDTANVWENDRFSTSS